MLDLQVKHWETAKEVQLREASLLVFLAFLSTHIAWRAGQSLANLPAYERPMLFAKFGPLGSLLVNYLSVIAGIATVATLVWGFLHSAWYIPVPLFVLAGLLFGLTHNWLSNRWPMSYTGLFPAIGAIIGTSLMLVTQLMLWP